MSHSEKTFGGIRHHYWEWPIASYLFLGGLGGGIFALTAIFAMFVYPSAFDVVGFVMAWPCFIAIACLAFGCFLLVFELGQPLVFLRCFIKSSSIICWGARLLTVCLICGFVWALTWIPRDWLGLPLGALGVLEGWRDIMMWLAGLSGLGIMLYTGIMLSTLKAHAFWATPVLPVLFTTSALSTACAAITLSVGWWPAPLAFEILIASEAIEEIIHIVDLILVACEIAILLIMVLSFLGAGNKTANAVAKRWVIGKWAGFFWVGLLGIGLVAPEIIYILWPGTAASTIAAPILVLCGGLLLRFMMVYSDDRAPLPGENEYYTKLPSRDAKFLHAWKKGENLY